MNPTKEQRAEYYKEFEKKKFLDRWNRDEKFRAKWLIKIWDTLLPQLELMAKKQG